MFAQILTLAVHDGGPIMAEALPQLFVSRAPGDLPGLVRITVERLFSAWKLYTRTDIPIPDKPLHLDTCYRHANTAINDGYVLHFVYDHGFGGPCHYCATERMECVHELRPAV
ncbi:hypothetical protein GCM10029978_066910 [Actinoallomurus acanthiterrae]